MIYFRYACRLLLCLLATGCMDAEAGGRHRGYGNKGSRAGRSSGTTLLPLEDGDIHIPSYGQSLSLGTNGSPALTTTQPFDSLSAVSFTALVEASVESHVSAMANEVRNGDSGRVYLASSNGVAGAGWNLLSPTATTTHYTTLVARVQAVETERTNITVPAVVFIHGETDAQNDCSPDASCTNTYRDYLSTLQSDFTSQVQAITGQSRRVAVFTDQFSAWTSYSLSTSEIPIEQRAAALASSQIFLVAPKYQFSNTATDHYSADGVHLANTGYRLLGEYYGRALQETYLNLRPWRPLEPTGAAASGSTVRVQYNVPCSRMGTCSGGPLVLDTTACADTIGYSDDQTYGFELVDPNPNPRFITGVALDGSEVVLTANDTIQSGSSVEYAMKGLADELGGCGIKTGSDASPRGNLRDADTTTGYESGATLSNWAVHSRTSVSGGATPQAASAALIEDRSWTWGYVADTSYPAATSATDWPNAFGGFDMPYDVGTYGPDGDTGTADSSDIGSTRIDEALVNTSGIWQAVSGNAIFDADTNDDILIRFIGDIQRPGGTEYMLWYGLTDTNNRYYIQTAANGNLAVVYGSAGADLTTVASAALPAVATYGIIDVYIRKRPDLHITIAVNGAFTTGTTSGAGGATTGVRMTIMGAFNSGSSWGTDVSFIGGAIGGAAKWWSQAAHTADVDAL